MDAGDIFRQGFNTYAPLPASQPRPISYHAPRLPGKPSPLAVNIQYDIDEAESHPARIAHTLTACTRCRQVSRRRSGATPVALHCAIESGPSFVADACFKRREKRDAILRSPDACLASAPARYANISTPQRAARSAATTSLSFKKKFASWKPNWASTWTRTTTLLAATKTLSAQAASCGFQTRTRSRDTLAQAAASP